MLLDNILSNIRFHSRIRIENTVGDELIYSYKNVKRRVFVSDFDQCQVHFRIDHIRIKIAKEFWAYENQLWC